MQKWMYGSVNLDKEFTLVVLYLCIHSCLLFV